MAFLDGKQSKLLENLLFWVTFIGIVASNYLVFMAVPNERVMGPVQRIFYFHVGSAIACYCSAATVLIASFGYLATRERKYDIVNAAASEVGLVFCSIVLASGMIWGHAAWNTWFRWEPRLVSFLLLWFIFAALVLLRVFGDRQQVAAHSAVLGIVAAVMVPVVIYSVKILPHSKQLHPEVVENRGLKDPMFRTAIFVAMFAIVCLQFLLVWVRTKLGFLEEEHGTGT